MACNGTRRTSDCKTLQNCAQIENQFKKPKASGKKPSDSKRVRKPEPEVVIDRTTTQPEQQQTKSEESMHIGNPNEPGEPTYQLYLRSMVPRMVEVCQRKCGKRLLSTDNDDYLLVKSFGHSICF